MSAAAVYLTTNTTVLPSMFGYLSAGSLDQLAQKWLTALKFHASEQQKNLLGEFDRSLSVLATEKLNRNLVDNFLKNHVDLRSMEGRERDALKAMFLACVVRHLLITRDRFHGMDYVTAYSGVKDLVRDAGIDAKEDMTHFLQYLTVFIFCIEEKVLFCRGSKTLLRMVCGLLQQQPQHYITGGEQTSTTQRREDVYVCVSRIVPSPRNKKRTADFHHSEKSGRAKGNNKGTTGKRRRSHSLSDDDDLSIRSNFTEQLLLSDDCERNLFSEFFPSDEAMAWDGLV